MKKATLIILTLLFTCVTASLAQAGTQVLKNQTTTVKAAVKNITTRSTSAAVKLTAYDNANTKIGNLCKTVYLSAGRTTYVDFSWKSPNYATGVYWSSKVEANGTCPSVTVVYDDHDDDDDDHDDDDDDDHDHGDDDSHH